MINALGIGTSATHMEWFFGPKGLRFSEIGCRPPGVGAWDLYSAGNDMDVYRAWADAIVHGGVSTVPSRRYASGIVALRPSQDGSISGYSGVDELQQRYGEWVIDAHLPPPGTPTQGVEAGYMANAYVRMRHPDYDTLRGMLDDGGPHACTSTPREDHPARTAAQADARGGGPVAGPVRPRAGGPVATITAGWQEREPDDAELSRRAGGPGGQPGAVPAVAGRAGPRSGVPRRGARLAGVLAELQELYLLRLDYALRAVYARAAPRPAWLR